MEEENYTIDDEKRRIIITGSLEQLIKTVKAIHRAKYPDEDPLRLDAKIDAYLSDEMPHMAAYLRREIDIDELQSRCMDLPQLTLGMLHRIKFAVNFDTKEPSIIARYFANDLPGEDHFTDIRANFARALESLQ